MSLASPLYLLEETQNISRLLLIKTLLSLLNGQSRGHLLQVRFDPGARDQTPAFCRALQFFTVLKVGSQRPPVALLTYSSRIVAALPCVTS